MRHHYWTHSSVRALAGDHDPVEVITHLARKVITDAIEAGVEGPPFDPFLLADYLKVSFIPREDIRDARTVTVGGKPAIEFNPNRPRGRVRYSISHELAHTLFPDWRERIRNRLTHEEMKGDDWQLEMLCNIGAAELLMPIGSFPKLQDESLSIDHLMELRKKFDTSTEALFLRVTKLTESPCGVFSASRRERSGTGGAYQIDYAVPSRTWHQRIPNGLTLPKESVVGECTAIGFTAKGHEKWHADIGEVIVECVGIPPYPNHRYPRVVGIVRPRKQILVNINRISYLIGDATIPRGEGHKIIAHIVNDKTPIWGAGFALSVRKKWHFLQEEFIGWAKEYPGRFSLGNIHSSGIEDSLAIVHMICQHGYGPSQKPRIRYKALEMCLEQLADIAIKQKASIHMPRIGCGQAGGSWNIVKELIDEKLCRQDLTVTVYDLPNTEIQEAPQPMFDFFSNEEKKPLGLI